MVRGWGDARLSLARFQFSSVQSLSCVWLLATPWTAARQASLSITNSRSLLNSCPLSWWCHPAISPSVVPFSSCPQSLPASGSFQMSQLFASGGRSIGVSASTSVLPTGRCRYSEMSVGEAGQSRTSPAREITVRKSTKRGKHRAFVENL